MKIKNIYTWIFTLLASAMVAIGRMYDERLEFMGVNYSILLSVCYILSSIPLLLSIKSIKLNSVKRLLYYFLFILFFSSLLWLVYGFIEYGVLKYLNFVILIIPLLVIIMEKFDYNDVQRLFTIIISFIIFLSLIGLTIVAGSNERLSVLGGGPIVFARWMIIGVFILFFRKKNNVHWILIPFFIVLSLAAGSRGPIFSLFCTFFIYIILTFQKTIIRIVSVALILTMVLYFSGVFNEVVDLGRTDRLVTKDSTSKNVRIKFAKRSVETIINYPFGVGIGNWQTYCNKLRPYHLLAHEYPHILVLEVFTEMGFVGGILLLLLLLKILYFTYSRMIRYRNYESSFYPLLFYLQLFLIINSFFSGDLSDSRLLFIIIAISLINKPLVINNDK
tara:strand:+ start:7357 stop:8526 length:1170 start_codon:yes stop_codon:yes gene_type:complete